MSNADDHKLLKFLASYGDVEAPQALSSAPTDSQLTSLALTLASEIARSDSGVVLDIGAGLGVLLKRLVTIRHFKDSKWEYCAVESEERHADIMACAMSHGIHKRTDYVGLDTFYAKWPLTAGRRVLVVIRNVLHELDIQDTGRLFAALVDNSKPDDVVIIQDLAVFPIAEKGNVCWDVVFLRECMLEIGFEVVENSAQSRSGNGWFNLIARRRESGALSHEQVFEVVGSRRQAQWERMRDSGALTLTEVHLRETRVAKIDYDLQFAALTHQLLRAGREVRALTRKQSQLVAREVLDSVFQRAIASPEFKDVHAINYFKNRANSQGALQRFLESTDSVTSISGPPFMGKSTLVRHVLSSFKHGRIVIELDMLASTSVWNFVEALLADMGLRVPPEVLGRLQHMEFAKIQGPICDFLTEHGAHIIVVLDHFERLLSPANRIADVEIEQLLKMMAEVPLLKVILTSRRALDASLIPDAKISLDNPPVGRFPRGGHVENLLGHFIGKTEFPESLLEAIDRHPYMAFLAGRVLEQEDGEIDDVLLQQLKNKLRNELMIRIATDGARCALEWISFARGLVPRGALERLANKASVAEALETGLIYVAKAYTGAELITCVGALRVDHSTRMSASGHRVDLNQKYHEGWAEAFRRAYSIDDDPRWIREAHYHKAVFGTPEDIQAFGRQYRSEIRDAGEHWFRAKKNFVDALWAYRKVEEYSENPDVHVAMRIASCLIRTGEQDRGKAKFVELFSAYPEWTGVRRSYVDGLLFLDENQEALDFLREHFPFEACDDRLIIVQYGRAYLGVSQYIDAINAFNNRLKHGEDEFCYRMLAQAYRRLGRRSDEQRVLRRGNAVFPRSKRMTIAYAAWLETNGHAAEAVGLLRPLADDDPLDAWRGFALVQALVRQQCVKEANQYYEEHGRFSHPSFLRKPMLACVRRGEGRYHDAIMCLQHDDQQKGRDPAHRQGQICEIYHEWASACPSQARSIARDALQEIQSDASNLPLNISIAKLCVLAGDTERFREVVDLCKEINPLSTDLQKIVESQEAAIAER